MSDVLVPENVELAKLDIEREKLGIEKRKLELEVTKLKWTAFSIVIPIVAVAATIIWGIYATYMQSRLTFQLESAKTVMAATTYGDQVSIATFLRDNFPDQLGADFLKKLDIKNFPDAPNVSAKMKFMQLIDGRGLTPVEAAQLWHLLYPLDDDWWNTKEVNDLLLKASSRSSSKAGNIDQK